MRFLKIIDRCLSKIPFAMSGVLILLSIILIGMGEVFLSIIGVGLSLMAWSLAKLDAFK